MTRLHEVSDGENGHQLSEYKLVPDGQFRMKTLLNLVSFKQ